MTVQALQTQLQELRSELGYQQMLTATHELVKPNSCCVLTSDVTYVSALESLYGSS